MGMFDSVMATLTCPKCGKTEEQEIQFYAYVGHYEPQMNTVRVGERLPDFPLIPLWDEIGRFYCDHGGERLDGYSCVIRFRRGIVSKVLFGAEPIPILREQQYPGRNTLRKQRRMGEEVRRETENLAQSLKKTFLGKENSEETRKEVLAFMLTRSIMRKIDYVGIAHLCIDDGRPIRHYIKENGKWRRILPLHMLEE